MKPEVPIKGEVYKGVFTEPNPSLEESLVYRLRKRAQIRLNDTSRKSWIENTPNRISALLLEAANALDAKDRKINELENTIGEMDDIIDRLESRSDSIMRFR
jgi:hypothetical protein